MLSNVSVTLFQDADLSSRPSGEARSYYSGRDLWAISTNMEAINVGLQIEQVAVGAEVSVFWEYSWDGINWLSASVAVISTKSSVGLWTGYFDSRAEIATFGRLRVDVEHSGTSSMVDATISMRALYLMKS